MNLIFVAPVAEGEVDGVSTHLGALHDDGVELPLREPAEKILDSGQRLGRVEVVVDAGHFLVLCGFFAALKLVPRPWRVQ